MFNLKIIQKLGLLAVLFLIFTSLFFIPKKENAQHVAGVQTQKKIYWFLLERKSNIEKLYYGEPNNVENSELIKTFVVKTGIPGEKPTPLPQLVGRDYWQLIKKEEAFDNEETAPYFLTLDVPATADEPFGPSPYLECNGEQCNWELPGYFGLHGIAGNPEKLSEENEGSSGCIRHTDEDITYLYNLLDPETQEIRYYIQDI